MFSHGNTKAEKSLPKEHGCPSLSMDRCRFGSLSETTLFKDTPQSSPVVPWPQLMVSETWLKLVWGQQQEENSDCYSQLSAPLENQSPPCPQEMISMGGSQAVNSAWPRQSLIVCCADTDPQPLTGGGVYNALGIFKY